MSYTGSKAQSGRGTKVSISAAIASPTYTEIGEAKSAPLSGSTWNTDDVSNFDSGIDEEFITTMRAPGEPTITGNRVSSDAGQVIVDTVYNSGALAAFQVLLPKTAAQTSTGDAYTFTALIISREFPIEANKTVTFSLKLKISGPVTFTAGT